MRRFLARPLARDVRPVAERATLTSELNAAFTASFVKGKAKGQKSKGSGLDSCSIGNRQGLTPTSTLKRRNSPFASHDRAAARNIPCDYTPQLLPPLPVPQRKIYRKIV